MTTPGNTKAQEDPNSKVHVSESFKADKMFGTALSDKQTYKKIFNELTKK